MPNNVRPHLSLLTEEQIHQTHNYALRILAETGVRVASAPKPDDHDELMGKGEEFIKARQ